MARRNVVLWFRALIVACLVTIAMGTTLRPGRALGEHVLGLLPALGVLIAGLGALVAVAVIEGRERLRPLVAPAWVGVAGLVSLGMVSATLGESVDPELLAFLLLGVVVATARTLWTGLFGASMAAAAYTYLAAAHGIAAPTDPLVMTFDALFLAMGLFAGFLSQEVEWEREEHEARTAELRQELADLGEHLRNVLSCVASGVLVVDQEGRVATYNRAAERILGHPGHVVLGRALSATGLASLAPLLKQVTPGAGSSARAGALDASASRQDVLFTRPGEGEIRLGYSATALENLAGQRLGTILVFQDVTLIRDYEARMLRQEQLAALGRMVSGIAHEFGNLLGGARGLLDLALHEVPPTPGETAGETVRETLSVVRETLSRALETVDNLLTFARGTPLALTPGVDVRTVVERALHLLTAELDRGRITVERRLSNTPPLVADAVQLEQAWINVVLNAIHATRGRPQATLRVGCGVEAGAVVLRCEDDGPGVPDDLRERIFEPFFTTKGALGGSEVPGTGLGLAMVIGVVEAHDGSIEVGASRDLGGAAFTIRLPLAPPSGSSGAPGERALKG